jgi:hypothetical protein
MCKVWSDAEFVGLNLQGGHGMVTYKGHTPCANSTTNWPQSDLGNRKTLSAAAMLRIDSRSSV